jgi:hypothetical protein
MTNLLRLGKLVYVRANPVRAESRADVTARDRAARFRHCGARTRNFERKDDFHSHSPW